MRAKKKLSARVLFGGRRGLVLEGGALHCAAKTEFKQSAFSSA